MKKREIPVMNLGISLIILIFMNVCLAAFAVLSLQNALSDYALTKKTAAHTTQYYKAVNKVQEQLAQKNTELEKQWTQKKTAKQKENHTLKGVVFLKIRRSFPAKGPNESQTGFLKQKIFPLRPAASLPEGAS